MIEFGVVNLLTSDSTLTGLVGNRLYAMLVPENAVFPCLSYSAISSTSEYSLDNHVFTTKRIQFDAFSDTYLQAKQIENALQNILSGYSGTLSDGTVVLGAFQGLNMDLYADDARKYRVLSEYIFSYVEPTPLSMSFDGAAFDDNVFA